MIVKIKKLAKNATIPSYAKPNDAGLDLVAVSKTIGKGYIEYDTGLAIEIPEGFVGLIFPRSSISATSFSLANSVGVVDAGYRGPIRLRFRTTSEWLNDHYAVGNKVGQLIIMPYPKITLEEVDELTDTERGVGGFGSSGN